MEPDEIELADALEILRVPCVESSLDVPAEVGNPELPADVAGGPPVFCQTRHSGRLVEHQQVSYEEPGAVAAVGRIPVVTTTWCAVNRGQPGDGASGPGNFGQRNHPGKIRRKRPVG